MMFKGSIFDILKTRIPTVSVLRQRHCIRKLLILNMPMRKIKVHLKVKETYGNVIPASLDAPSQL